jgi:hypothetical protein
MPGSLPCWDRSARRPRWRRIRSIASYRPYGPCRQFVAPVMAASNPARPGFVGTPRARVSGYGCDAMASDEGIGQPCHGLRSALVLGVPLGSGTAHIVQLRPVGIEDILFQRAPKGCDDNAHHRASVAWVCHRTRPLPEWSLHDVSLSVAGSGSAIHRARMTLKSGRNS